MFAGIDIYGHSNHKTDITVSMQRLSTTSAVTPKGRIINSCTVDCWTVFMLIPTCVKVINGHPKGKPWNLPPAGIEPPACKL